MADFVRGIKAGVVSGAIYGAISGVVGILQTYMLWNSMSSSYGVSSALYGFVIIFSILWGVIVGLILGLIVGLIYAALYNHLPGSASVVKAIVIMLLFWLVFSVGIGYITTSFIGPSSYSGHYEMNIISGLILSLLFGFLLGMFWDKFTGTTNNCPSCTKNVPKDARFCPYCGHRIDDSLPQTEHVSP